MAAAVPISKSLSKDIERLFKVGGFALSFGYGGLMLIVSASAATSALRLPIFAFGCFLTFACLCYFVFSGARARNVTKRIKDDLPLLDELQHCTLETIEIASLIQSVAFKHIEKVQKTLELIVPLIESIPVVGSAAKRAGLDNTTRISSMVVDATESAKIVVMNFQTAVESGDLREIKKYAKTLREATATLKTALKQ